MAATAILNYYFVTPDNQRSPFAVLNLPFKFCVHRVYTFWDIAIRKFCKFGLKCLSRPQKLCFWGVLTPKLCFLSLRPLQDTSVRRNTRFESLLVVIGPTVWSGRYAKCTKKERTKSKPKFTTFADPFLSSHINQILHVGSYPGYLSWFWVSERSVSWGQVMVECRFALCIPTFFWSSHAPFIFTQCGPQK